MGIRLLRMAIRCLFLATVWGGMVYVFVIPALRASTNPVYAWRGLLGHCLLSPFCHQRPDRCFHVFGVQMPLCARCFGLLAGGALSTLVARFWPKGDLSRLRRLFFAAAAVMATDVVLNGFHLYKIDLLRWFTGLMLGCVSGLILLQGIEAIDTERPCNEERGVQPCP